MSKAYYLLIGTDTIEVTDFKLRCRSPPLNGVDEIYHIKTILGGTIMPQINSTKYTFEMVAQTLKGFSDLKRKALQLEFEITNYMPLATGEDIIDTMTFGKPEGDDVGFIHIGNTSDKTSKIAVSYAEKSATLNMRHKQELEVELRLTQAEIIRMEYYISILNVKHKEVLSMLYLEEITFVEAAEKLEISTTALKKLRIAGIRKLVDMYNTIVY